MLYTSALSTFVFVLVFLAWAGSELIGPVRWSQKRGGEKRDRGSLLLGTLSGLTGTILAFLFPVVLPTLRAPWQMFFVGIVAVFVGIGWRWWSIWTLGRYFTAAIMIQPNQPVIQHGPYKFIRHPSYSGVLLVVVGFGLMIGNWLSILAIVAGLLLPLLHRISVEERVLLDALPPYKNYMQRTKRLLPFVY